MSSNVGLSTPRGSGTSGYVQRNLSVLKPRDTGFGAPYPPRSANAADLSFNRTPDAQILSHDRARQIEIQVFELQDTLEAEGEMGEEEVERTCGELRMKLLEEEKEEEEEEDGRSGEGRQGRSRGGIGGKGKGRALKPHQVHELAEAKILESERLRRALGIGEGREGRAWEDGDRKGGRGEVVGGQESDKGGRGRERGASGERKREGRRDDRPRR